MSRGTSHELDSIMLLFVTFCIINCSVKNTASIYICQQSAESLKQFPCKLISRDAGSGEAVLDLNRKHNYFSSLRTDGNHGTLVVRLRDVDTKGKCR